MTLHPFTFAGWRWMEAAALALPHRAGPWWMRKASSTLRSLGKRIKWLILPLHESETDRHLIGLSG
ncbi:hypothetical protein CXB48_21580 [Stutzerimonas stutzeri]|nr:hypothetical protein CXB48_21580 [Stutzerimonas stutzeri]